MDTINIRLVETRDINSVARLSQQLGYDINEAVTARNIELLDGNSDNVIWVASNADAVIGWMQVSYLVRVETGRFCEIVGLVVDEHNRGKGVGRMLLVQAIQWCKDKNCTRLKVRTNVTRKDTHRFYAAVGFEEVKEQKVFEMDLSNSFT